jgi:hypothetical protein
MPDGFRKVEELFVVITIDESNNEEGIVALQSKHGGPLIPMVTSKWEIVLNLHEMAKVICKQDGSPPPRVLRFASPTELVIHTPEVPK